MPRPMKKRGGDGAVGVEAGRKKYPAVVPNSPRVTRSANSKGGTEGNPRNLKRATVSTG